MGNTGFHLEDRTSQERWRRHLLSKGGQVAKALEDILAGKDVRLEDLPLTGKAGEDAETRARIFLARIDRAIKAVGTRRFGRCKVCGIPLAGAVLDERPWEERCLEHAH